jgi:hypothetical protein
MVKARAAHPPHTTFEQAKAFMTSSPPPPRRAVAEPARGARELVHEFMH